MASPADQRANVGRFGRSEEDEADATNDRLASTNEKAVTGDMCPIGIPFRLPVMGIPRCSAFNWIPMDEVKNRSRVMRAQNRPTARITRCARRLCGRRAGPRGAIPSTPNMKEELGAIGIKFHPQP